MKFYVKCLFVVLLFGSLTSFVEIDSPLGGLSVGSKAPDFEIPAAAADGQAQSLSDLRGRYVLLNFWASYDAQSRMRNVQYAGIMNHGCGQCSVAFVSVSFDDYQSVFEETLRLDNASTPLCFDQTDGSESAVYKDYHLDEGLGSYLIDAGGRIVAKNISAAELAELADMPA